MLHYIVYIVTSSITINNDDLSLSFIIATKYYLPHD